MAAVEQDTEGLIDGVTVAEPVLELAPIPALTVRRGSTAIVGGSRPLYDYLTLANLYQPCASSTPKCFQKSPPPTVRLAAPKSASKLLRRTVKCP